MNNLYVSKPYALSYSSAKPRPPLMPYSRQDTWEEMGFYELLHKNISQTMSKRFKKRGMREWFLVVLFLTALCLAAVDSHHFGLFIFTKIAAAFLFLLAYCEGKGLWKETDSLPVKYRYVEKETMRSGFRPLRFYEK